MNLALDLLSISDTEILFLAENSLCPLLPPFRLFSTQQPELSQKKAEEIKVISFSFYKFYLHSCVNIQQKHIQHFNMVGHLAPSVYVSSTVKHFHPHLMGQSDNKSRWRLGLEKEA